MMSDAITALAERPAPRKAHTQINRQRGAMLRSWRIIITAEIDRLCTDDNDVADYWIAANGDGVRLTVESVERVDASTLVTQIAENARKHARRVMS